MRVMPDIAVYMLSARSSVCLPGNNQPSRRIREMFALADRSANMLRTLLLVCLLSTGFTSSPLLVSAAPAPANPIHKQAAPTGTGNVFLGSLTWYPQQPDFVLATISNNSTTNYAVLAKNNLFDDNFAYAPFSVSTLSGVPVALVGTRYPYPTIDDTQFKAFPVGAVWERYFNMSSYIPPSSQIRTSTSQCFTFSLPITVETLNLDMAKSGQHLADLFLGIGLTEVAVDSNPIHMNVTVQPSTGTTAAAAAGATQSIPAEPSGVFLAPSEQTGSVINLLQNSNPDTSALGKNVFNIGATPTS